MACLLFCYGYTNAQYVEARPPGEGIFLKASIGRSIALDYVEMTFTNPSGAYGELSMGPGAGYNLLFGTGMRSKFFDFELLLEESMLLGYATSLGNGNTVTFSSSFFKTNLYGTGYLKIPYKEGHNAFRIGVGPFMTFPGKFKAKLDGDKLGYARYAPKMGYNIDLNLLIEAKTVYVSPGLRLKISELESTEITFTENQDKIEHFDISSIDFYLALQF